MAYRWVLVAIKLSQEGPAHCGSHWFPSFATILCVLLLQQMHWTGWHVQGVPVFMGQFTGI